MSRRLGANGAAREGQAMWQARMLLIRLSDKYVIIDSMVDREPSPEIRKDPDEAIKTINFLDRTSCCVGSVRFVFFHDPPKAMWCNECIQWGSVALYELNIEGLPRAFFQQLREVQQ